MKALSESDVETRQIFTYICPPPLNRFSLQKRMSVLTQLRNRVLCKYYIIFLQPQGIDPPWRCFEVGCYGKKHIVRLRLEGFLIKEKLFYCMHLLNLVDELLALL